MTPAAIFAVVFAFAIAAWAIFTSVTVIDHGISACRRCGARFLGDAALAAHAWAAHDYETAKMDPFRNQGGLR